MDRIRKIHSRSVFKSALRRGISFHHSGMNNRMRTVVEMLFREKYLQVKLKKNNNNKNVYGDDLNSTFHVTAVSI